MMNRRGLLLLVFIYVAFGLLCWFSGPAKAAESDRPFTCSDVRAAVKTVQESASVSPERAAAIVEAMARGQGVDERRIAEAKRCLKP